MAYYRALSPLNSWESFTSQLNYKETYLVMLNFVDNWAVGTGLWR